MADVISNDIVKIHFNRGRYFASVYTIYHNQEILKCPDVSLPIELAEIPNLTSLLDDDTSLCWHFQNKYQAYRVYLERLNVIDGKVVKETILTNRNANFITALMELEEETKNLYRKRNI